MSDDRKKELAILNTVLESFTNKLLASIAKSLLILSQSTTRTDDNPGILPQPEGKASGDENNCEHKFDYHWNEDGLSVVSCIHCESTYKVRTNL